MSLTISSLAVLVLVSLFRGAGIELAESEASQAVAFLVQLVSVLGVYWGRFRHGDVSWWGGRKAE